MTRVWVLNLDAEEELAAARAYQPTDRMRRLVAAKSALLVGSLVRPGDLVLGDRTADGALERARQEGWEVCVWSPTRSALDRVGRAGLAAPDVPAVEVLRTVNARPFAAQLHALLDPAPFRKRVSGDLPLVLEWLAKPADEGWLVRRTFGAAGRGRRRMRSGVPDSGELAWIEAGLRIGPLTVEPWVPVVREFTRSGHVDREGRVRGNAPCFQATDDYGAWTRSAAARAADVGPDLDARLGEAFEAAGRSLAAAGYHGPYGVDAFTYRRNGRELLQPLSEINARYTMDWNEAERSSISAVRAGT